MNEGDLAIDETQPYDVLGVGGLVEHAEDLVALRMRPPAPRDRTTDDQLGDVRDRPPRRLQHDSVLLDERGPVHRIGP